MQCSGLLNYYFSIATMKYLFTRYCLLLLLLPFFYAPATAQSPVNYSKVDDYVKNFPFKATSLPDLRIMAREISRQFTSEEEKARAAFYWITHNITYDCEGYRMGNGVYEAEEVMKKRKAVCAGYADLFKFFCDELKLTCEIVEGFATGIGVKEVTEDNLTSNHAWNVVKIKGQWKLVDATWAAGSANRDCTKQYTEFDEFYFFSRPDSFILKHFPDSAKWQLLDKPFSAAEYVTLVQKDRELKGWTAPIDTIMKRKVGEIIRIQQKKEYERNIITIQVEDEQGKVMEDVYDSVKLKNGYYYYDYTVKKAGTLVLSVNFWLMKEDGTEARPSSTDTYTVNVTAGRQPVISPARNNHPVKKN